MIKMLSACTEEIDDVDIAVQEILDGLDLDANKRSASVGILTCYSEFIESGVVEALCAALPFDVIGCTSMASAVGGHVGTMTLCLSVLTSDDVHFSAACSAPMTTPGAAADTCRALGTALGATPAMGIAFFPMIREIGGETLLHELEQALPGVPLFGSICCDHNPDQTTSKTIFNGKAYEEGMALLLMAGEVAPRFYIASISDRRLQKHRSVVTKSDGCVLKGLNDTNPLEYMRSLGLFCADEIRGLSATPLLVDYNDGTEPVARAIYLVQPDGSMVCGGNMPVGASVAIGTLEAQDVLATTEAAMQEIMRQDMDGLLLMPCMSRNLALGAKLLREMECIERVVDGRVPHHLVYSGGEFCPVHGENDETSNRFHNFTLVACML